MSMQEHIIDLSAPATTDMAISTSAGGKMSHRASLGAALKKYQDDTPETSHGTEENIEARTMGKLSGLYRVIRMRPALGCGGNLGRYDWEPDSQAGDKICRDDITPAHGQRQPKGRFPLQQPWIELPAKVA